MTRMTEETKTILRYLSRLTFCDCTAFTGEQGRRTQQLIRDINAGEIKGAKAISASRRFRSLKDEGLVFIVRTR